MANEFKVKNGLLVVGDISGSTINGLGNASTFSQSVDSRLDSLESSVGGGGSVATRIDQLAAATASVNSFTSSATVRLNRIEESTASLNAFSASENTKSATLQTYTASVDTKFSTLQTYTASVDSTLARLRESTSSLNAYTASNDTTNNTQNTRLSRIEEATASINSYTASLKTALSLNGSNVTINGDLTVAGTTTTVNSTTVNIADNILELNYGGSAVRAGILTKDATGTLSSGSLLWDGSTDQWIAGASGSEVPVVTTTATQTLSNKTVSGSFSGSVSANQVVLGPATLRGLQASANSVGSNTIISVSTGSYTSIFVRYAATKGANGRAGYVIGYWNGGTAVFNEFTTVDVGDTSGLTFNVSISGGNAIVAASVDSTTYTINTSYDLL